jgi:poly-gamma-glutamate synthesis protein (capsule biosynthesis protein)
VAVGDIMLGRSLGNSLAAGGEPVFDEAVTALLDGADVAVGNLESPVSNRGVPQAKSYTFRAPPEAAAVLAAAGFDVVGLANNHTLDYGTEALADTSGLLAGAGVLAPGGGRDLSHALEPAVLERAGLRLAFVSLVDAPPEGSFSRETWEATHERAGVAWADAESVERAVRAARESADVVVALLHFGAEFSATPTPRQRELAHTAIDAGAALVLGTHPHVVQEVEPYGGGLIAYSLGNFAFDGFEGLVEESAALHVTFEGTTPREWELVPLTIEYGGRPRLAPAEKD